MINLSGGPKGVKRFAEGQTAQPVQRAVNHSASHSVGRLNNGPEIDVVQFSRHAAKPAVFTTTTHGAAEPMRKRLYIMS